MPVATAPAGRRSRLTTALVAGGLLAGSVPVVLGSVLCPVAAEPVESQMS